MRRKVAICNCCGEKIIPDYTKTTGTLYRFKFWCDMCWRKLVVLTGRVGGEKKLKK